MNRILSVNALLVAILQMQRNINANSAGDLLQSCALIFCSAALQRNAKKGT